MNYSGLGYECGINTVREYLEIESVWISTARDFPTNPFAIRLTDP